MKVMCGYCNRMNDYERELCETCGAPLPEIKQHTQIQGEYIQIVNCRFDKDFMISGHHILVSQNYIEGDFKTDVTDNLIVSQNISNHRAVSSENKITETRKPKVGLLSLKKFLHRGLKSC